MLSCFSIIGALIVWHHCCLNFLRIKGRVSQGDVDSPPSLDGRHGAQETVDEEEYAAADEQSWSLLA